MTRAPNRSGLGVAFREEPDFSVISKDAMSTPLLIRVLKIGLFSHNCFQKRVSPLQRVEHCFNGKKAPYMFSLNPVMLFLVGVGQTHVGHGDGPEGVMLSLRDPQHRVGEVCPLSGLAESDGCDQSLVGHGQGSSVLLVGHRVGRLLHDIERKSGHHVAQVGRDTGQGHLFSQAHRAVQLERAELAILVVVSLS